MKNNFQSLIETLQDSIFTWDYFTDFEKAKKNVSKIERELALLNTLIGKENIEEDFLSLVEEYPKVRKILPILIAIRREKVKKMKIKREMEDWNAELKDHLFYDELNANSKEELLIFFRKSGLKNIFQNKNIKSIVDYVFGVEVGLDTNARKNRTGKLMEGIVGKFIADFCKENKDYEYTEQATQKKIKEKWNHNIRIDKNNRKFDFAVFNKHKKQLFIFEVNYYSGGGSKLKSVAGEFEKLYSFLKKQNLLLYWITDGEGWVQNQKPLEECFEKIERHIYNIEHLKNNILDRLLK